MIGNAVPPILTYYIFQSMLEVNLQNLILPSESLYYHEKPPYKSYESNLGLPAKKFPASRKFQFSVPNLRYGSGVRFELSNNPKSKIQDWSFKFFHGNSKDIKEIQLNSDVKKSLAPIVNTSRNTIFNIHIDQLSETYKELNSGKLQELWTSSHSENEIFNFLDHVGTCVRDILNKAELKDVETSVVEAIVNEKNKKLEENKESLLVGFYFLSSLNNKIFKQCK
jgi:DNA (cytosine-5)-methyltransferase 1